MSRAAASALSCLLVNTAANSALIHPCHPEQQGFLFLKQSIFFMHTGTTRSFSTSKAEKENIERG